MTRAMQESLEKAHDAPMQIFLCPLVWKCPGLRTEKEATKDETLEKLFFLIHLEMFVVIEQLPVTIEFLMGLPKPSFDFSPKFGGEMHLATQVCILSDNRYLVWVVFTKAQEISISQGPKNAFLPFIGAWTTRGNDHRRFSRLQIWCHGITLENVEELSGGNT